jgi:hypothetical protein
MEDFDILPKSATHTKEQRVDEPSLQQYSLREQQKKTKTFIEKKAVDFDSYYAEARKKFQGRRVTLQFPASLMDQCYSATCKMYDEAK